MTPEGKVMAWSAGLIVLSVVGYAVYKRSKGESLPLIGGGQGPCADAGAVVMTHANNSCCVDPAARQTFEQIRAGAQPSIAGQYLVAVNFEKICRENGTEAT